MQLNFWVLKLRISTLVNILRKAKGAAIAGITYLEGTKSAVFFLRLLVKLKAIPAVIHKVQPRDSVAGPVLYLAFVRNDKGEVIRTANQGYAQLWGEDKIISQNSFKSQCTPKFYLEGSNQ